MKTITLHQPWATAMALGLKTAETRSWNTSHRGHLAIHAGKAVDPDYLTGLPLELRKVPTGAVLGVVTLVSVERMTNQTVDSVMHRDGEEFDWGLWETGRFAWWTEPVIWFAEPIPARGQQGMWNWDAPEGWRELPAAAKVSL